MTYNQTLLDKYRKELLYEELLTEKQTECALENNQLQEEEPEQQHKQEQVQTTLHSELEHKMMTIIDREPYNKQNQNICKNNSCNRNNSNSKFDRLGDVLLIRPFKSKTCPYCNGLRDATVKHINPNTKPSTPQEFYNNILVDKYKHLQSYNAQCNLNLEVNSDRKEINLKDGEEEVEEDASCYDGHYNWQEEEQEQEHKQNDNKLCKHTVEPEHQETKEEISKCMEEREHKTIDMIDTMIVHTNTDNEHLHDKMKQMEGEGERYMETKMQKSANVSNLCSNKAFSRSKMFVVGPMVDQSELPFRMLCREYGATLAYTPMLHAKNFVESAQYRSRFYSTNSKEQVLSALHLQELEKLSLQEEEEEEEEEEEHPEPEKEECTEELPIRPVCEKEQEVHTELEEHESKENKEMEVTHTELVDRPLIVQICGNDADTILKAARLVLHSNDYDIDNDKDSYYNKE